MLNNLKLHVSVAHACVLHYLFLYSSGLEWWERRAGVLREGSKYPNGLEVDGFFTTGHQDGAVVLVMPVSHM